MRKHIGLLVLAAIVLGIAGLGATADHAAAQEVDLSCTQTTAPNDNGGVGVVECTLSVTDLPEPLSDFTLTLIVEYVDVDGSNDPSPGDRIQCVQVLLGGGEIFQFCRPDVPEPPDLSPPNGI